MKVSDFGNKPLRSSAAEVRVKILSGDTLVLEELHRVRTDSTGNACLLIGKGQPQYGKYDSLVWSVGSYFLETSVTEKAGFSPKKTPKKSIRVPEDLSRTHVIGDFTGVGAFGSFSIPDSGRGIPRMVVLDLKTAYANKAYPLDIYPVFRHLEWLDPDGDGLGSNLMVSFSENTLNYFVEETPELGHVTLYSEPFQKVLMALESGALKISLTRPEPMESHGQTYRLTGPWTVYYYFEW